MDWNQGACYIDIRNTCILIVTQTVLPGNANIHRTVFKIAKTCIDVNVLYV